MKFQPRPDPRALLKTAVDMLAVYTNQLTPQERALLQHVQKVLAQHGDPQREHVQGLQQAYLRLKVLQENLLETVEEQAMHLVGQEADAAQAARLQLDGGSLLTLEQLHNLHSAHIRNAFPQILENLEAHTHLLSEAENNVLQRARFVYDVGGKQDPKLQQAVFNTHRALAARQYIF